MNKKKLMIFSAAALLLFMGVCSFLLVFAKADREYTVSLYFKNSAGNSLDAETRIIEHNDETTAGELMTTVLNELTSGPKSNTTLINIFDDVEIISFTLNEEGKTANIDLSGNFFDKTPADKLFIKSSLVYTLTALGFVDNIVITSEGIPVDEEPLNRKNILLNPDIAPEKVNYQTMTLYFTDSGMSNLWGEQRLIEVKQSQDIEYQIVEQLLAGPESSAYVSPIPTGTKLINTTTENGICYVNLSSAFLNKNGGGITTVQVYSIVNTLTALDSVTSVQFYIEGQKASEATGEVDISKELVRDESLIKK